MNIACYSLFALGPRALVSDPVCMGISSVMLVLESAPHGQRSKHRSQAAFLTESLLA